MNPAWLSHATAREAPWHSQVLAYFGQREGLVQFNFSSYPCHVMSCHLPASLSTAMIMILNCLSGLIHRVMGVAINCLCCRYFRSALSSESTPKEVRIFAHDNSSPKAPLILKGSNPPSVPFQPVSEDNFNGMMKSSSPDTRWHSLPTTLYLFYLFFQSLFCV